MYLCTSMDFRSVWGFHVIFLWPGKHRPKYKFRLKQSRFVKMAKEGYTPWMRAVGVRLWLKNESSRVGGSNTASPTVALGRRDVPLWGGNQYHRRAPHIGVDRLQTGSPDPQSSRMEIQNYRIRELKKYSTTRRCPDCLRQKVESVWSGFDPSEIKLKKYFPPTNADFPFLQKKIVAKCCSGSGSAIECLAANSSKMPR